MGRQFDMVDDSTAQTLIMSDRSDGIESKNLRPTTRDVPVVTRWDAEVTARILDTSVTTRYSQDPIDARGQGSTRHDSPASSRRDCIVTHWNSPVTSWYLQTQTRPLRDSAVTLLLADH